MLKMVRQVAIIWLLFLFFPPVYGMLQTQVNHSSMASDEVLTLTISSNDTVSTTPDLTPLEKDFHIVGTSQNSQLNIINGSMRMESEWQIALIPKHTGDLILPAITVGKEKTKPQIIHVFSKNNVTSALPQHNEVFMEATVAPKEAFIQEQFVYTLKLFFNRSIENPYLMGPDLPDANITQKGEDIIYSIIKNGKYYQVLERSYSITPKNTGHFPIQPPLLKGYIESQSGKMDIYGFSNYSLQPIKVVGPVLAVTVKPKPVNFKGQWFPAKKVSLDETWVDNPPAFREGEPVTRIIEVTAEGAAGEQIPMITVDTRPGLNSYPQQPTRETKTHGDTQVGKLKQKLIFIPTQSGKLILPGVKIHWWNSVTRKEQVAFIPPRIIKVQAALKISPIASTLSTSKVFTPNTVVKAGIPPRKKGSPPDKHYLWPSIAILFFLVWMGTVWMWRRQIKYGVTKKPRAIFGKISKIRKQLQKACLENNPKRARYLFLKWSISYWQDHSIHSLTDVVHLLEQETAIELLAEIMQLERIFYGKDKVSWNGMVFWQALEYYLEKSMQQANKEESDPLPPLYCEK
jgi:hypothetical protein